jgi:outer membrane protein TolC
VDQAYWQIVSVAGKKKLAESYAGLLEEMERDIRVSIDEGVATEADALTVRVKKNEADMMVTKATGGLALAKMLLCKQIGLDLGTDIVLADELDGNVPLPALTPDKDFDRIYADRPELRSLDLAAQIYDRKVDVMRADMLPTVALTANYLMSNPNLQKGFTNDWGGMMTAGVVVRVPLFHGFEALQKTRKAKAEASLYHSRYEDTRNLVNLQVSQLREQRSEALDRLAMAESNLDSAEENLRTATLGFEEGVLATNVALAAQTAWLQARSEYIDAGIELQMTNANLRKAEGGYNEVESMEK